MKMMNNKMPLSASLLGALLLTNGHVMAEPLAKLSDKQRIERLERMMNSDVLRQQAQTIDSLREEIAALREQLEQQEYELDSMKQRQRNLYLDMDRRISSVESGGAASRAPVAPPRAGAPVAAVPVKAGDIDGQQAYTQAFSLLKEGRYQESIRAFEKFKADYPDSKYADNAQYWLGEANYVSRNYKQALQAFEQLVAQYPDSPKNPGAYLKIGYVYFELKNWDAAKQALQQVIDRFPDNAMAKKAKERLQRIKREGH